MSAEPAQKTSRTEEGPLEMTARDVHLNKIQTGPLSGSRGEIAPQESSLVRSINEPYKLQRQNLEDQARQEEERLLQREEALEKVRYKIQAMKSRPQDEFQEIFDKIEALKSLQQEGKQTEQQKSQRLHQVRDTPVHKVANSAKNDGSRSVSYVKKGDTHKEPAKECRYQVKEAVAGPPLSVSRDGHHPEQKLKQSVPDVPSRGEQKCQAGCTSHEDILEGQAIRSKEAPPPTKNIFSIFMDRIKSEAGLGSFGNDNAQEGASAHPASMINQLYDILGRVRDSRPSVVDERSEVILSVMLNYAIPCLQLLLMLLGYTQPILASVIAGAYIAMDMSVFYQRINDFRHLEDLKLYIGTQVCPNVVRYQLLIAMARGFGPACAITLVRFVPDLTNVMQRILWIWRCTGTKEEPLAQISFQRYCRPDTAYIKGPFPNDSNENCQSAILDSFDVKIRSRLFAVVWDMLVEIVQYASFYVVLFSGDSWLSKIMALAFAYFVGSKYCPRPRTVDESRSVHDLILRAYSDTIDAGKIQCPSVKECLDDQPMVSHYLQVLAIKMVETVEGRKIDDGGFHSLGAPAISLFLFILFFVPVATILALGWHWFGPTVTITFP